MSRTNRLAALGVSALAVGVGVTLLLLARNAGRDADAAQPPPGVAVARQPQWVKVQDAVNKGLPKTAIDELEPIIKSALKDKAYPEAVWALAQKVALEGNIQGNKPEERVTRWETEIANAPAEMHPVMEAVLAHWYWHYFQQNRWRFVQRTATAESPGKDFTTWDLPRLFAEIDKHFVKALEARKELKGIKVSDYAALLEKGGLPDAYRPTLFDFVAHEALEFYGSAEQAGAKAADEFEIAGDSPALAAAAEFLKWNPQTTDEKSRLVKGVKLYQELLAFHADDKDRSAYLDADIGRLRFMQGHAVGQGKNEPYRAALTGIVEANPKHEAQSLARYYLGASLDADGKRVEAHKVATAGRTAFPQSPGGKLCHNLIQQIEAKEVSIRTERVWNDPLPVVRVTYRNLDKVYFRLVKADYVEELKRARWRPEQNIYEDARRRALVAAKPAVEFNHDLPATDDYLTRTEDVSAPKDVPPGFYYLLSSHNPKFTDADNTICVSEVWASSLAVVSRQVWGTDELGGFVLDAKSGDPVEGAKVQLWVRNNNGGWAPGNNATTDKNGLFTARGQNQHGHLFIATHGGQQLATAHDFHLFQNNARDPGNEQVVFFTDRSLYRPGQTIQFKGIAIRFEHGSDNYATLSNRTLTVVFRDVNGKDISRVPVKTNEYGSFNGSVTAPRDRLTGRMHLHAEGVRNGGGTQVTVEEYKRPKFLASMESPKEPARLNQAVLVPGKAVSYTGVPIGGAKVRFRVTREVRYPDWFFMYCWWRPMPQQPAQEIAHGHAVTEADGTFVVTFNAAPDKTVPEADEPSFRYRVTADVTDTTGETRSADRTVEVGYTALRATVSVPEWVAEGSEQKLTVRTTNLDGVGQSAKGTLKVYALKQPEKVARPDILDGTASAPRPRRSGKPAPAATVPAVAPKPDPAKPVSWELGEVVHEAKVETDKDGTATVTVKLHAGLYRAVLETADPFNKSVTAKQQVQVVDPAADRFGVKIPQLVAAPKWSLEPGELFTALWGTGYDAGRAFVEIEHRGKVLQAFWTDAGKTQARISEPVKEAMRGGFTLRVTQVRENRAYLVSRHVAVPWTNKNLTVKWEHFVNKLEPGKKETFTAVISGPDAKKAVAEMVAAVYDQSLDAFLPHQWATGFGVFRHDHSPLNSQFENLPRHLQHVLGGWHQVHEHADLTYRHFPHDITQNMWGYQYGFGGGRGGMPMMRMAAVAPAGGPVPTSAAPPPAAPGAPADALMAGMAGGEAELAKADARRDGADKDGGAGQPGGQDPGKVEARKNLSETAFFYPHLVSDADGVVRMEFTMPEALTKWKFLGFAHDKDLRGGGITADLVTAKDLMAEPNPPRFLRTGDALDFTCKLSNTADKPQAGRIHLTFADARTEKDVTAAMGISQPDLAFDLKAGESKTFAWRVTVPAETAPVLYKVVAASDRLSDGEQNVLPVLSNMVFVTESLPLPIRNAGTKTFQFPKLLDSAKSDTLKHQSLTVQMVSQPAWYAVMALPYLMEYPHECSEQTFNRLYANALARHIANSDPKIRRVFDQWKNTPALDSPLEKNQDLKAVLLDETPWVRQANAESQARRNVGILFDQNRLNEELGRVAGKLAQMQHADGSWPWFPGGPGNEYITLYIATGYGRLRHLGVKNLDIQPAVKAMPVLDGWMDRWYRNIKPEHRDKNHLSPAVALYLYGRSFFLKDRPVPQQYQEALGYWQGQAKKYWLQLANRQSQAHIALGLSRMGDAATPAGIAKSIKERSVSNDELGMFWRDTELSFFWYRAPIETQAVMVELFAEVADDSASVEDCKVWLLKQKQTQDWKTTKATADAVYALLLRGENLLKSDALVEVSLAGQAVKPEKVEAGTGFYEQKFVRGEVKPEMGAITLKKTDPGVSWGSIHWQYLEDISKVTPHEGTPLKLEKKLFKKVYTKAGPVLEAVNGPVAVGDEIVTRVVLRTDRDMEYVHLRDHRGSGTEPVNVLSRYRYQDGLAYYESTKDTASHFFIDYLPKGTYVFEYAVRVQLRGSYPTGMASIQCMYAPEFNSHSESIKLEVK